MKKTRKKRWNLTSFQLAFRFRIQAHPDLSSPFSRTRSRFFEFPKELMSTFSNFHCCFPVFSLEKLELFQKLLRILLFLSCLLAAKKKKKSVAQASHSINTANTARESVNFVHFALSLCDKRFTLNTFSFFCFFFFPVFFDDWIWQLAWRRGRRRVMFAVLGWLGLAIA